MAERSVSKAILVGRLGADAETRYTQNGTPVSRVSVAMNRQWKDRDDQIHEDTDWIPVILWRSERLAEFMTKGKQVYV
ncbi:MAG TPA: single-stranded DNA-binding protein, partial [Nitrospira sp.]|nr:single-stranded DNA-binding protein [Nitrospira sp.]